VLRDVPPVEPSEEFVRRLLAVGAPPPAPARRPKDTRPGSSGQAKSRRIPRARYLVAGAATLAALGAGTASISGGAAAPRSQTPAPSYAPAFVDQPVQQLRVPRREPVRRQERR
ncbi:hypothetical protein, partial [Actinocorallia lasiicapitis]